MSGTLCHAANRTVAWLTVYAAQQTPADVHTKTGYSFDAKPDHEIREASESKLTCVYSKTRTHVQVKPTTQQVIGGGKEDACTQW